MYLGLNNKIIFAFILGILLVGTVSALTFDNRLKSYDELTKTIIIDDNFGLGGDLVKVQLLSNTYTCGVECSTVWNVTIYKDDDNFLSSMEFKQIQGTGGIKSIKYEVITGYRDVVVEDKVADCTNKDERGLCTGRVIGTHIEKIPIWSTFDPARKLVPGNYIIKLTGQKEWDDTIDWIPTFYGEKITQWAFWAAQDPTTVWEFNEDVGDRDLKDTLGLKNITLNNTFGIIRDPGKLNNSVSLNITGGGTSALNVTGGSQFAFGTDVFTVAYWIKGAKPGSGNHEVLGTSNAVGSWKIVSDTAGAEHEWQAGAGRIIGTIVPANNGNWQRVVWVRSGTGANQFRVYINNTNVENGTWSLDNTDASSDFNINTPNVNNNDSFDSVQIYKGYAFTVADVNEDWNNGAGIEAGSLTVSTFVVGLNSPTNNSLFTTSNVTFNASVTSILATNLTNATLRVYNSTTNLFNESVVTVTGDSVINESLFNVDNFIIGTYFWNVEFCGIADNVTASTVCSQGVSNLTFSRIAIINQSINFSNPTIEGSTESFFLNLTFNSSLLALNSAIFNYNNTPSPPVIAGIGDNRLITSSIVIPGVTADTNKSFLWQLAFTDLINSGSFVENTTTTNQSVLNIGLDNCAAFTNRILNFTVRDEELQTFIADATIETAVNLFDQNRVGLVANVSGNFTNPTTICLSLNLTNTITYSLDTIVRYESPLHATEFHNIVNSTVDVNSTVQDIILFDLNISDSTEFQLSFTGSDFLPVENALVFVDRQYISENQFKTVELPKTDSNGQTVLHLVRNDIIYNIRIIKDGAVLGSFENLVAFCEDFAIGDCKIDLNAGAGTEALFDYDNELGITFTSPNFDNDTRVVTFNFLTVDGTAKTVLMNVTRSDIFGNRTICEDSLLSSGGTLSCTVPANIDDADLIINVFVDGEQSIFKVVKLELTDLGVAGYLVFFVMALSLILLFSSSKTGILIAILLGFAGGVGLQLITSSLTGLGASGLWLIIIVLIGIWKLNKDRIQ